VGRILGRRLRLLDIQVNLAPCLDLDTERENPVIGSRSFGANPVRVAALGRAFALGLLETGVVPCFKHYPGHGGTRLDSHLTLPAMPPRERRLHQSPFRACAEALRLHRLAASGGRFPWIMSAHVDWGDGLPASLSPRALAAVRRWAAQSPVVTDALEMGAVFAQGNPALRALLAGNDCLLFGRDWRTGLEALANLQAAAKRDAVVRRALVRSRGRLQRLFRSVVRGRDPSTGALRDSVPGSSLLQMSATSRRRRPGTHGPVGKSDLETLKPLHRAAVRLSAAPDTLPAGAWTWIVPEQMTPYVRLRGWLPPKRGRRFCAELLWVPEQATGGWFRDLARSLRRSERPILVATLFRGIPGAGAQAAWLHLLRLPRVRLVAHLLDEGWPAAALLAGGGPLRPMPVCACTSGPSPEGLTGLADCLGLPDGRWTQGADGLFFPVDRGR
jgi:hypothetical protein